MISAADIPATLTPEERLHFAQEAYRDYRGPCFWSMPYTLVVTETNLPLIINELKVWGGHNGWKLAHALSR